MRIPLSKVYRAFPAFDPFPDHECERYLRYAYRQSRMRIGCIPLVAFAAAFVVYVTLTTLIVAALDRAGLGPSEPTLVFLLLLVGMIALPAIIALMARDHVLLGVLRDRIQTARCPQCRFSLLGLPVTGDAARCPECGLHIVLSMHNLTAEDLRIRRLGEDAVPGDDGLGECGKCRQSLKGVAIVENTVRCPQCGENAALHKRGEMENRAAERVPEGFVDASARVTACPGCGKGLLGAPIFEGQTRCVECGFIANVVPRPGDVVSAESVSEIGLRIKGGRIQGDGKLPDEGSSP